MREGWEYKKLGDVASFINGYAFKPEQWSTSGTPIVRIQNLNNPDAPFNYYNGKVPDKVKIKDGDLLISWSASLGAYIWQGGDAFLNQHIFKVEFDKLDIDKMFLKHAVVSKLNTMAKLVHGATMKHIVKKDFDNTRIPYPSKKEQQSIVSELDKINELISLKKSQLEDLDSLAQSIFYDMFGDPVENEKEWKTKKYGECFTIGAGGTPSKSNPLYWDNGIIPWIGSNMCQNCIITETDGKYITSEGLKNSSAKMLDPGTVLVALVGATIGKVALLRICTSTNQNIAFIKVNENKLFCPEFVYYHLMNQYDEFMLIGNGDFKMANQAFIKSLTIMMPPLSLQQTFAKRIEVIEQQKQQINKTIKDLETLLASRMQYWFD